ncbi:limonene-1,2-epoxide hydrolase family protein [Methanospirillum hungatei]|uniref:limonene-1,2-epoxide hydrolase family protein n=1 Tax=Methanospirillum hungatei TaxID=2203 RepID=UPI0026F20FB0|nr:limonene-1,2-epoxide hydrolase family protein [Methanospirillum hungatei]MCA1917544.1 nuclear transport factor 2 family protein [Methanospirillum hungatei]
MSTIHQSPIEVVRAFFDEMSKLDFDTALVYISDDCEYENLPMPDSKVIGPAGIRAILEPFFAQTIENEFIVIREAAQGQVVFIERRDRHLLSNGWIELPVTGVFEVQNGFITVWREYFNFPTIAPMFQMNDNSK